MRFSYTNVHVGVSKTNRCKISQFLLHLLESYVSMHRLLIYKNPFYNKNNRLLLLLKLCPSKNSTKENKQKKIK